jgi:prepilin-type N-terminal cleavage/methylation domain-containing protein
VRGIVEHQQANQDLSVATDSGLTLIETLIALVVLSMVALAVSMTVSGGRPQAVSIFDARAFVEKAKREAIVGGRAITIAVTTKSLSRSGQAPLFSGDDLSFSVDAASGSVVALPDGAFSHRLFAMEGSGVADLTPVLEINAAR